MDSFSDFEEWIETNFAEEDHIKLFIQPESVYALKYNNYLCLFVNVKLICEERLKFRPRMKENLNKK
jgi:hypothetical protein